MIDEQEGISHLVNGDEPKGKGVEVHAICGYTFETKGDTNLPVCSACVDVILQEQKDCVAIIDDMNGRMVQIAKAIGMKDELGQNNWLHHEAEQEITRAFWRPGPARPEGPEQEDGSFDRLPR